MRRIDSLSKNVMKLEMLDQFEEMTEKNIKSDASVYFFEVAWEVVNKVGGIYTVIRSKAPVSVEEFGDRFIMLGPYKPQTANVEFEEMELPDNALKKAVLQMRSHGLGVFYGRWLVAGYPQVILFDMGSVSSRLGEFRSAFYNDTSISVPFEDVECNDAILFGNLVVWLLAEFRSNSLGETSIIAHFHEWMCGIGLILSRTRGIDCTTIFTTHATLLGRYLCAGEIDFYNNINNFALDKEAGDRGIYHRYCMERAAANFAHVFTTVSDITGVEAEALVKRKPDCITPNGLNVQKYTAIHEFQNMHAQSKEKIHEFLRGHFSGHCDFDFDKTLCFFLAGRYEYSNKGADMFLEALARLNYFLQAENSDVTVVAFIIMPGEINNYNVESLRGQAVAKQLRDSVKQIQEKIGKQIYKTCLSGKLPDNEELMDSEDTVKLKRAIFLAQRKNLPPICTHNMVNDVKDKVLTKLRACKLFNHHHDRVKVIFHPEFLNVTSPILPMEYDDFVRGCHLGVFPSYYEPWGYTPAECTVMGVPSVTTNLSGFGCFMEKHIIDPHSFGIYVIDRRWKGPEESLQQLTSVLINFCKLERRQRIILRNRTERLSDLLDWKNLGVYYMKARFLALYRKWPERHPYNEENLRIKKPLSLSRASSAPGTPLGSSRNSPSTSRRCSDSETETEIEPVFDADAEDEYGQRME